MKKISFIFILIISAITHVNAKITIEGNNSDCTSVPAIATELSGFTALKFSEDAANLYFYAEGTIGVNTDFYIDTHDNATTSYIDKQGYDFLFDNGTASDVSATNNGMVKSGCEYYVSTTGNDANDGTLASPFKTIQKALNVVSAGCAIYVRGGTYKEHLSWVSSGTDGNIITLQNYNGEKVYLDGGSGGTNDNEKVMFTLSNMSYLTIDGFIIHNNFRAYAEGIYYNGTGTDITIRNCELYDIGWTSDASAMPSSNDNAHAMVFVGSQATTIDNVTIENCHIHNCITGYSEGLTMVGNVEYFTIINNTVNDITNIGIDLAGYWSWTGAPDSVNYARNGLVKGNTVSNCTSPVATSAGIYCDGAQYITIENNIVYGNPVGIDIGMENDYTITGSVARNNLIYNNTESGIFFGAYASGGLLTNSIIEGNTLYNNDMGHTMGDWTGEIYLNKTKDCKIINNIIYPRDATNKKAIIMPPKTTTNLTVDYNLYWRATAGVSAMQDISTDQNTYTLDTHKVEADPQFVAPVSDFHVQNTSPAVNAGDPSYVSFASTHPLASDVDIDGQARVYGDSIDIGCDEVTTTSTPILSVSPSTLSAYTYAEGTGPSSSQSFTLSGTNLDGSQVVVSAPANYEVSLDNSTFSTSVNVNYSDSTLANTTIYVRLKVGLSVGTYNNELVTCNDNGTAPDVSVTNNGTVTSSCSYYVSTTGNDSNDGTLASPFKTIQKALDVVSPGCTIYVKAGTYSTGTIWLDNKHGSAGNIIKIRNYDSDIAIIDGSNLSGDKDLFYLENTSYITIEGLILENNQQNNASGFNIQGNCQNISIKNCEIRNVNFSSDSGDTGSSNKNAYPLIVYANQATANSDIIITGNKIHDCRTSWSEGLAINGNVDGFEISNNSVYNITNIGIDAIGYEGTAPSDDYARNGVIKNNIVHDCPSPYADAGGIYVDGGRDIIIENNIAYNNQYGIEIGNEHSGTTTQNITVRNNLFYDNTLVGIKIGGYNGNVSNCSVTGNSCYSNTADDWRGELELSDKLTNTTITNNIFYSTNSQNTIVVADGSSEPSGLILNYNVFYHSGGSSSDNFDWYGAAHDGNFNKYTGTGHGANSQFTDPLFVTNGSDYHLQSTSPAINAGDPNYTSVAATYSIAVDEDMDGQARVQNSVIDCGIDESSTTPMPSLLVAPFTLSGYTYIEGSGPSSSQNFTLSGTNLDGSAVNVTAPANYEVSSDNSTFTTSVNVNYSGSTLANTSIYVRLNAGLSTGTYDNELVTCNDNGTAPDVSVTNNGTVTASTPTMLVSPTTLSDCRIFSVKNKVYIKRKTDSPAFTEIYDLSGKLIHKQNLSSVNTELTISLEQGIYLVKVYNSKSTYMKKILILK